MTRTVEIFVNGFKFDTFRVDADSESQARRMALAAAFRGGNFHPNGGLVTYTVDGSESRGNY